LFSRVFKAFEYRDFRLMWIGACTSSVGTWMQKLAQSWLVLQLTDSAWLLGVDAFLGEIPIFLFSLVGGVVADRMDRRHLLLVSQVIQLSCAFGLAALIATGLVEVWHILTLSFIVGTAQAFGGPAYQALIPMLVKSDDLPNAIALNSIQFNVARVIGPMLGGIALTQFGAAWCFGLNGLSFVAVIISLLMLRIRFVPPRTDVSMLHSMKEGIGFIRRRSGMESLIALAFLITMLGVPLLVFLPVIARDVFHGGPAVYTWLLSVSGVGSVVGALVFAGWSQRARLGRDALRMLMVLGATMGAFALSKQLVLSLILLFVTGAALIAVFSAISSLVQLICNDEIRGRVMSVYNVAFRGGMPIGSLLTGRLVEAFHAPAVLAVNGVLLILLASYFLLVHRKVGQL
jgi:predicted MFS family arabinose efflux permease